MSHQTWNIERDQAKGVRSTVKVWPTGEHKRAGMRYRMLRGEWSNTGSETRDEYLSRIGLVHRLAEIEASFLAEREHYERGTDITGCDI